MSDQWYVVGGQFRNVAAAWMNYPKLPNMTDIIGDVVRLGPYTEEEADRVWLAESRKNIDTASYRLIVVSVQNL